MRLRTTILVPALALALVGGSFALQSQWAKERGGANDSLKNSWEGKPLTAFEFVSWMNTDPLKAERLKGKVVLLDFWAHW